MGLRGRKPMPREVKEYLGNPGRRPLNLADGVNPAIQIPTAPSWLSKHAIKEWDRASAELFDLGLIGAIDLAMFAVYCQTWGDVCDLELLFEEQKRTALKEAETRKTGLMDAYFQKTPTGFLRDSAIHRKLVQMRVELDRYARNFGMNPSARARVTASNNAQIDLPGIEPAPAPTTLPQGFAQFSSKPHLVQ